MPKTPIRGKTGRWSMTQVYTEAGITLAVARTVVKRGLLDLDALTEDDIVMLRVAAALLEAPRPLGRSRTEAETAAVIEARNVKAMTLARQVVSERVDNLSLTLLVFPDDAVLAPRTGHLAVAIEEHAGQAGSVLPLGQWIADLPSRLPLRDAG